MRFLAVVDFEIFRFLILTRTFVSFSTDLGKNQSSVVITGVPTKEYRLPTHWIQENTIVINVASYKNVDENELLQIPGVIYVPLVGKVTVAMLERNLMRLYKQFHHPAIRYSETNVKLLEQQGGVVVTASTVRGGEREKARRGWLSLDGLGTPLQLYTAFAVTVLIVLEMTRK